MEIILSEYGPWAVIVVSGGAIIGALWKYILTLQQTNKTLDDQHNQRYDQTVKHYETQFWGLFSRYETLVKELAAQNKSLENTLERLQEGYASDALLAKYVEKIQDSRK